MSAWGQIALADMLVGYGAGVSSPWKPAVPVALVLQLIGFAVIVRPFGRKNRDEYFAARRGCARTQT